MKVFQRGILSLNEDLCDLQEMYYRTNTGINIGYGISLKKEGKLRTDTYFNSLSVSKVKKYTTIDDVFLLIKFIGKVRINIIHITETLIENSIFCGDFTSLGEEYITLEIEEWIKIEEGMIFFEVESLEEVILFDFFYATNQEAIRDVRLAIVITHFNRQKYILPALDRIKDLLFSDNDFSAIEVIISDNSKNLEYKDNDRIHIFHNENYGGSGGFSFGLLMAKDQGFTHCLFMDDDASTEIESIKRTYNFLQYCKNEDMAIVGAMFYEDEKNIQYEAGAILKKNLTPRNTNLDMINVENLLKNEVEDMPIHYGGWWFFAFPIIENIKMPFPFFVRGDDVCFGLLNKFRLVSFNGICSWQEDFLKKNSPFIYYQYFRSMLILYYASLWKISFLGFIKFISISLLNMGVSYRYDLMHTITIALKDVIYIENWDKNINMVYKISELSKIVESPQLNEISELNLNFQDSCIFENLYFKRNIQEVSTLRNKIKNFLIYAIRIFIIIFSFFSIFIPKIFFRSEYCIRSINDYKVKHAFMNKKILLKINEQKVIKLEINKIRFLYILLSFLIMIPTLFLRNQRTKKKYEKKFVECTTEKFWRNIFKMN
ncbi:MAG: glycosyltransferase [Acinetobacter sp.]